MSLSFTKSQSDRVSSGSVVSHGIGTGDFTFRAVLNRASTAASHTYFFGTSAGTNLQLFARRSSSDIWGMGLGGAIYFLNATLATSTWYDLFVRRIGTTVDGWVNGVKETTTITSSASITDSVTFQVGADGAGGSAFDGLIEEFCCWNRALSQGEIESLANARLRSMAARTNLMAWWPLDVPGDGTYHDAANGDYGLRELVGGNAMVVSAGVATWSESSKGLHWAGRVHSVPHTAVAAAAARRVSLGGAWVGGGRVVLAG